MKPPARSRLRCCRPLLSAACSSARRWVSTSSGATSSQVTRPNASPGPSASPAPASPTSACSHWCACDAARFGCNSWPRPSLPPSQPWSSARIWTDIDEGGIDDWKWRAFIVTAILTAATSLLVPVVDRMLRSHPEYLGTPQRPSYCPNCGAVLHMDEPRCLACGIRFRIEFLDA